MNKNDYLNKLKRALSNVSASERERTLLYYGELIDDRIEEGVPEEQVISELEQPQEVVSRLMSEGVIHRQPKRTNGELIAAVSIGVLLLIAAILVPILSFSGKDRSSDPDVVIAADGEVSTVTREYPAGTEFEFELISSDLTLQPSEDDSYHLYYRTSDRTRLSLKEGSGSVRLKEESIRGNIFSLRWGSEGTLITLQVPEKEIANLYCSTVSGDVEIQKARLDGTSITTVSGRVKLASVSSEKRLSVTTTSGNVDMRSCDFPSVSVVTVSGNLELKNTGFDTLDFETVSGDLEGELMGKPEDYRMDFSTVSGSNSLRGLTGSGEKEIRFNSVSGDVDLDFEP